MKEIIMPITAADFKEWKEGRVVIEVRTPSGDEHVNFIFNEGAPEVDGYDIWAPANKKEGLC